MTDEARPLARGSWITPAEGTSIDLFSALNGPARVYLSLRYLVCSPPSTGTGLLTVSIDSGSSHDIDVSPQAPIGYEGGWLALCEVSAGGQLRLRQAGDASVRVWWSLTPA